MEVENIGSLHLELSQTLSQIPDHTLPCGRYKLPATRGFGVDAETFCTKLVSPKKLFAIVVKLTELKKTFGTDQTVGNSAFVFAIYIAIRSDGKGPGAYPGACPGSGAYFVPVPSVVPVSCLCRLYCLYRA